MNRKVTHPTPTRCALLPLLAAGTLALSGCGDDEPPGWDRPAEQAAPVKPFVVPPAIEQLMATEFPADGQIHVVRSVGRFDIQPETAVCSSMNATNGETHWGGVDGSELFGALGQTSVSPEGRDRIALPDDPRCHEATAVLIHGLQSDNRNDKPYKLVLAVWQGGTVWVAGVERVEGGPRPRIFNPYGTDRLPIEVRTDRRSLSEFFIENGL